MGLLINFLRCYILLWFLLKLITLSKNRSSLSGLVYLNTGFINVDWEKRFSDDKYKYSYETLIFECVDGSTLRMA